MPNNTFRVPADIRDLLDTEAARINSPSFIADDPVQFPRRFSALPDIEIAALLSATIAWGNRRMICRNAEKILSLCDNRPHEYVMDRGYEELPPELNLHRTFFARHMQYLMRGLRAAYVRHGSLDALAAAVHAADSETPAWTFTAALAEICREENDGRDCSRALPSNLAQTALKRINMALRWLVRDDGIVDMGVWRSIPKSKLFIPLDVHVGNTARDLGLLTRRSNDRKAVVDLTATLRSLRPDDPVWYDYALFGIGVEDRNRTRDEKIILPEPK